MTRCPMIYTHCVNCGQEKGSTDRKYCNSCAAKRRWEDPQYRQRAVVMCNTDEHKASFVARMKVINQNPEYRKRKSELRKELWQEPEYRKKMDAIFASSEYREKLSAAQKVRWEDPRERERCSQQTKKRWTQEYHAAHQERLKILWQDDTHRERMRVIMKERWRDPEYRQAQSDRMTAAWQDPDYRQRMDAMRADPEYRMHLSEIHRALYSDDVGSDYPPEFNEDLRERIRDRDDRCCMMCGIPEYQCDKRLDVHHINYDKQDSDPSNLVALCVRCHASTGHNRQSWLDTLIEVRK